MLRIKTLLHLTAFGSLLAVQTSTAQLNGLAGQTNLYAAFFKGVCTSTNEYGLVYESAGNRHFIEGCAAEHGVTNLNGLRLVYNSTNDSLQVIRATNQLDATNLSILCTVLSFEDGVSLPNTNNTVIERLAHVYVGTNLMASGTLTARERYTYGPSNEVTSFRLIGQLAYSEPAVGTNSATICRGTLVVSFGPVKPACVDDGNKGKGKGKGHDKDKPGNNGKHLGQLKQNAGKPGKK